MRPRRPEVRQRPVDRVAEAAAGVRVADPAQLPDVDRAGLLRDHQLAAAVAVEIEQRPVHAVAEPIERLVRPRRPEVRQRPIDRVAETTPGVGIADPAQLPDVDHARLLRHHQLDAAGAIEVEQRPVHVVAEPIERLVRPRRAEVRQQPVGRIAEAVAGVGIAQPAQLPDVDHARLLRHHQLDAAGAIEVEQRPVHVVAEPIERLVRPRRPEVRQQPVGRITEAAAGVRVDHPAQLPDVDHARLLRHHQVEAVIAVEVEQRPVHVVAEPIERLVRPRRPEVRQQPVGRITEAAAGVRVDHPAQLPDVDHARLLRHHQVEAAIAVEIEQRPVHVVAELIGRLVRPRGPEVRQQPVGRRRGEVGPEARGRPVAVVAAAAGRREGRREGEYGDPCRAHHRG